MQGNQNTALAVPADPSALEKAPAKPVDVVRSALEKLKPQMAMALPRHLTPDRLVRVAMTAIQNTPALLECDRMSLFRAVMTCAQLGLEPDGVLGQAYLVPFKGKVQFIPGYKGLITLARNSGEVVSISAHEVCSKDHFRYQFGLDERLEHVPATGERGEVVAFYAVARFKEGGHHFDVLTRAEVDAIRDKSQGWMAFKSGRVKETPWESSYAEMGKKTAIRRISKYLPMNVQKAAAIAEMYESGRHAELGDTGELVIDPEPAAAPGGPVIDVGAQAGPSALDRFAGTGEQTEPEAPAGEATPAESAPFDDGPELLSSDKVASLRSQAERAGLDADQLSAEISGSGLAGMPASFETSFLREVERRGKKARR